MYLATQDVDKANISTKAALREAGRHFARGIDPTRLRPGRGYTGQRVDEEAEGKGLIFHDETGRYVVMTWRSPASTPSPTGSSRRSPLACSAHHSSEPSTQVGRRMRRYP